MPDGSHRGLLVKQAAARQDGAGVATAPVGESMQSGSQVR